jgi:hypothetical protein
LPKYWRRLLSSAFRKVEMFARIASPRIYFAEQIFTFCLSAICLVVDAWAVYHTVDGFYRVTNFVSWFHAAYIPALWTTEIALAFLAVNLLRFSFSTRAEEPRAA